jgi:hypothetical protein
VILVDANLLIIPISKNRPSTDKRENGSMTSKRLCGRRIAVA